jgi:putative ABC transport system ATP-binding protein
MQEGSAEISGANVSDVAREGALSALRSPSRTSPLSSVSRLRRLLALEAVDVGTLAWYSAAIGLLSLAVPVAVQSLVNTVAFTALAQPILVLSLLVMLGLSLAAWLRALRLQTLERLQQRILVRATHDAIVRVTRARLSALRRQGGPELMNRFFEVVTIQKAAAKLLVDGMSIVLQSAVSLLLLAFYHPALLAFDVVLIIAIGIVIFPLGRGGIETAAEESKKKYRIAAWLEDVAAGVRSFKLVGADQQAFSRANALAADYVHSRRKQFKVLLRQTVASYVVQIFAVSGLLGLGGTLVLRGELTLGQLVAAELVVAGVTTGLTKLGQHLESFYDLTASVDKLGAIVDLEEEPVTGQLEPPASTEGLTLSFEGVSFSHSEGGRGLSNVSFTLPPHATMVVWGHNASGKSTLAELCIGLHLPDAGAIRFNGVDIRDLALDKLRREVTLVSGTEIFDGTVADNLLLGWPAAQADLIGALRAAALDAEVAALPNGISTPLGHTGVRLTSSQAARLMLARALTHKPQLIVIDEALDGLDRETIQRVLDGIRRYAPHTSVIVLTSREDLRVPDSRSLRLIDGRLTGELS